MKQLVETHEELFPMLNKFSEQLKVGPEELLPYRQTRNAAQANPGGLKFTFHGYLLTSELNKAKQASKNLYTEILSALEEAMAERLDCITEDPLFKSIAAFSDTHCYKFTDFDDIFTHIVKIKEKFEVQLLRNRCDIAKLKAEAEIIFNHVKNFESNKPSSKTWPMLFSLEHELGNRNVLHIAEISIALPIRNAKFDSVFSFLCRVFSKDQQSFKNDTLEDILHLQSDMNFSARRYDHAIEMFLAEYLNGEVRKRPHHLDRHNYPNKRKSRGKKERSGMNVDLLRETISSSEDEEETINIETLNINLNEISDDNWSDSEDEIF